MGQTGLDVAVLGPLQLSVDGAPVVLGAPKQRAVFAMLAINRNRPVASEALIDAAWGDQPVPAARASLQSYISNLRRLLATAALDPQNVLASAPPGYRLNVADADFDLARFNLEKTAGLQASAAGDFEAASRRLSTALAQWRGPVLDDLHEFSFVETFATALSEEKLLAHSVRAEAEIACGRAYAVIGELEVLAADNPYREPLWTQLITAYYVMERQSDALQAFRRLKTALAEELGIDPGPTVSALHAQILRQEPLDIKRAAKVTAARTLAKLTPTIAVSGVQPVVAGLRDASGKFHQLRAAATRIGRLPDNDIVLEGADVSRHHAVIVDTGTSFVITDLRSSNGVQVQHHRISTSADLAHGDHISIGDHQFTLEIRPR